MRLEQSRIRSRIDSHDIAKLLSFPEDSYADRVAFTFEDTALTFRELHRSSRALAGGLIKSGVGVQDRITTLLPNCLEIWQLYFAAAAARGIFMPLNRDLATSEISYMISHAEPKIIVTNNALLPRLQEAMQGLPTAPTILLIDEDAPNARRLAFLEDESIILPETDPEDVVLISYTSGSTARPKAMAFSHRVELDGAGLYENAWGLTQDDKVLIAMSLGWTFGVNPGSFPELRAGGSVVLLEKFNPVRVLEAIATHKVTVMKGVPTMYAMMLAHVQETGRTYDLSSLRLVLCAGADLPVSLARRFKEVFGIPIVNFLGMGEVKLVASPRAENGFEAPEGSVGTPPPGVEVRFVDEKMNDVPIGHPGEFLVRSIGWMAGYFRDPEKTAACNLDGWYVSGDLGYRDENGFIYFVGRSREQIIRGGAKVAPAEVEEVLAGHPGVTQCAVIGVEDALYGEAVKAFIVTRDKTLDDSAMMAFCAGKLAPFKVPTIYEFVESLPMGPTGKVQKKLLR